MAETGPEDGGDDSTNGSSRGIPASTAQPEDEAPIESGQKLPNGPTDGTKRKRSIRDVAKLIIKSQKTIYLWKAKSFKDICDTCKALNIDIDKFIIKEHSSDRSRHAYKVILPATNDPDLKHIPIGAGTGKYRLGTFGEISRKAFKCPLCSLVKASVKDFEYKGMTNSALESAVCFASWQVDGREVERDGLGRVTSSKPRTRRIQLHWDNELIDDSHVVLRAPEEPLTQGTDKLKSIETVTQFLGRNAKSAAANTALVKGWLGLCQEEHRGLCNVERDPKFEAMVSQPYFGVVNVHEMRLTSLPPDERYLALSYVWGVGERYTTTLANVHLHQAYGGLETVFAKLPKAIRHAIQLVRSLGERYLWIDSLCIVQDSDNSWNLNAQAMDLVYGNAYLTICAADGDGALVGLKALHPSERYISQHTEECAEKLVLMVSHLAEDYIKRSRWNTRGWTFQERLLSRRCLIFASERVFFQCRSAVMSEDIIAEQCSSGWSIEMVQAPLQMLHELFTRPIWVYMECVRLYSARTLGRPSDILAAFNGMSNLMESQMGCPLMFGLPSSHFDLALLWQPQHASKRRASREEVAGRTKFAATEFPSWSWCGWEATVEYPKDMLAGCLSNVRQWLKERTWIQWHIRDSHGNLRPLLHYSVVEKEDPNMEFRWRGYDPSSHKNYRAKPTFERTLPEYPFCVTTIDPSSAGGPEFSPQRFLQFFTYSAFLRVIPHTHPSNLGEGLARYDIADYTGDWCGSIVLDKEWANKFPSGSEQEFLAISEALDFNEAENELWTYYISKEKASSEWDLYYVLLVETDKGISRRRGLGKVFKESFKNCCLREQRWQEVILE